jgi:hypothetical protein
MFKQLNSINILIKALGDVLNKANYRQALKRKNIIIKSK